MLDFEVLYAAEGAAFVVGEVCPDLLDYWIGPVVARAGAVVGGLSGAALVVSTGLTFESLESATEILRVLAVFAFAGERFNPCPLPFSYYSVRPGCGADGLAKGPPAASAIVRSMPIRA